MSGIDYAQGVEKCKSSARIHAAAAYHLRGIAYGFAGSAIAAGLAVSHAALAEEEAAKAAYCAMVANQLVGPEVVEPAFASHPPKTYLFHALVREKILQLEKVAGKATVTLKKQPLTAEQLKGLWKEQVAEVKEHDDDRNAGFYVSHDEKRWYEPGERCSDDIDALVYRYLHRAEAVLLFCDVIMRIRHVTEVSNVQVAETHGDWLLTWDEI